MDTIRRALGEDEISYFGFSYGSELGGTWATLFPDTVRAAVLDGAADPNADEVDGSLQQAAGFEATLTTFLAQCSANPDCAFHNDGDAEGAFDQLMLEDRRQAVADRTRPSATHSGRRPAGRRRGDVHGRAVGADSSRRSPLPRRATAPGLLALYDSYYQRQSDGTWDNSLEAFQTIHCMDAEERLTVEEEDALSPQFNEVAPRFSPGTIGQLLLHVLPRVDRPARRDHGSRRRPDRRVRRHR